MRSLSALLIRRWRGALVAWLPILAAFAGSAAATTVLPLDLRELTGRADRIFLGRVEDVRSGRDASGLPAVWTTFAVDESLKGQAGSHVTLKELGTSFGGSGTVVTPHAGIPRHRLGESVVLFVHADSTLGFTSPVGLGQGCFRIREQDGGRVVENDVGNRNLAVEGAAAARAQRGAPPIPSGAPEPLPLTTLLERVRGLVAAGH